MSVYVVHRVQCATTRVRGKIYNERRKYKQQVQHKNASVELATRHLQPTQAISIKSY